MTPLGSAGRPTVMAGRPEPAEPARRSVIIGRMATLSRADVEHVAHLARLGLTDDELDPPRGPTQPHPRSVRHPRELPTDHIAPTAQTIELDNILRDDVVVPSLPVEAVLANVAERDGDFIVVPAILGGD